MHFHALRRIARPVIACALAAPLLLTACGGGSGELDVTFDYPFVETTVLSSNNVAPTIQGLEGHSPSCSVTGGSLPKGMSINGGSCALTGSPLESGNFSATVTLQASDASGSVTSSVDVTVDQALIVYPSFPDSSSWGIAQSFAPTINGYSAQAGDRVTYAWSQDQSEDPDNLRSYFTLDSATGQVAGTFTGGPNHSLSGGIARVVATIVRNGASVVANGYVAIPFDTPAVYYPSVTFVKSGGTATFPVSAPPFTALGFTVTYSVSGVAGDQASVDPSTGALTISNPANESFLVNWTATKGNQVLTGNTIVVAEVG